MKVRVSATVFDPDGNTENFWRVIDDVESETEAANDAADHWKNVGWVRVEVKKTEVVPE